VVREIKNSAKRDEGNPRITIYALADGEQAKAKLFERLRVTA